MLHRLARFAALTMLPLAWVASPACAGDYGWPGRSSGPEGTLLISPANNGMPGRGAYVIGNPGVAVAPDPRYNAPPVVYGVGRYGSLPGAVYAVPIEDRLYCPESRAYYPSVQECATPWLRMRPGGGVSADSPIPSPNGQPYR